MATVKQIVSAQLSQRQRQINQQAERAELFDPDRLLCNIIRVDGNINVPSRPGFVWCQEYSPLDDTSPFHAFNDKIQAREGLTVWIGKGLGGRREVLDWNNGTIINTPDYAAQKYLPTHHSDHEWPDFKPGPDVVNVYPRSLSMLRTYPGEGGALTVSASPLRYIKGNALVVFPGKNSLDISASQPASGLARFVGIYLDPDDNTLKSIDGATTSDSPAITPDSPAFPESAILSANVRLNGDQTVFSEIDMVDVRQILDASGAIDGARVSKLVSPDGTIDPVVQATDDGNVDINSGQLFIRGSDGRVGVGTPSPNQFFHVRNSASMIALFEATGATTFSGFQNLADTASAINSQMFGSSFTGNQFGNARAETGSIFTDGAGMNLFTIGSKTAHDFVLGSSNLERMRITSAGAIGIGTPTPQAIFHIHETISGFIVWEFDGLDATVRTIIPNGTGDVLYRLTAMYVLRDSAAAVASGTTDVSNAASVNLTVGGNTVRLRVNADGSTDVARTAGTDTIKVALVLRWL